MLSKSELSFIKSLHLKKFRKQHGLFLVEGFKSVTEFIHSDYVIETIYCTSTLAPNLDNISRKLKLIIITEAELQKITALTTPQGILATIRIPKETQISKESFSNRFTLALDGIQDPGNLGTIIRTADWFGFTSIVCSDNCVEVFNPKVVQATMGSLARINVSYACLPELFKTLKLPVYGALLDGKSIYDTNFKNEGIVLLGNEGQGISDEVMPFITHAVTIPRFGEAESLNVAISAAIFCSEIKRSK